MNTTTYRTLFVLAIVLAWFVPTAHARWYDPTTGRWLQRDPLGSHTLIIAQQVDGVAPELGYIDGMSRYEYVGSDPLSGIDPEGLRNLTKAERQGVCNKIQQRYDSGQLDVNSYRSARKNFDCDGVGIGERIGRAVTAAFVATCGGGGYGFVDCLGECIDDNSSAIANILMLMDDAAFNLPPAGRTGEFRNLNPVPRKRPGGFGGVLGKDRPVNTTNWQNYWKKLSPEMKAKFPLKWFKAVGRANVVLTLAEGGYMAAIESYCMGHCIGLRMEGMPRYQSHQEMKAKSGGSSRP